MENNLKKDINNFAMYLKHIKFTILQLNFFKKRKQKKKKKSIGFNLNLSAVLAPNKRVSLFFEALKPDIDFSSLAMKVLDGIFFQQKPISSIMKICFLV